MIVTLLGSRPYKRRSRALSSSEVPYGAFDPSLPYGVGYNPTAVAPPPAVPADATSCSTWDFFFNSAKWKACATAAGQAQLQLVADNAAYYYGQDSTTAQVAQQAAAEQETQVPVDVGNVATYFGAGQLFYTPGGGNSSALPWWLWAAAGILGAIALVNVLE